MDIELLKQQQVRPRPCPSTALRSPPLQLPRQASHITCLSVVPTPREHPGCSQVPWRVQQRRYAILHDRLQRQPGVLAHRHSPAPPASTTALRPARVLSGARCSSNIMRKMSQENFGQLHGLQGHAGHCLHGRGTLWWSGAGAAAGGPPIDETCLYCWRSPARPHGPADRW